MDNITNCLFIGGCKDGTWMGVRGDPATVDLFDYTAFHRVRVTYYRDVLIDADMTRHVVYVAAEVRDHIIAHLLQGYTDG